jgi:hypothetical protein
MKPRNGLVAFSLISLMSTVAYSVGGQRAATAALPVSTVQPNAFSEMDCNGWSPTYKAVAPAMKMRCVDPVSLYGGKASRFYDNGHYVGHDEPTTKFISSSSRSGNTMTYLMQLSSDPAGTPTTSPSGTTVSDYAELSPTPWFGLPICDSNSFPVGPCTPDSDSNTTSAGDAFMELQFYPPGYGPFLDSISTDPTHWVSAINIDSFECVGSMGSCFSPNTNCIEPLNFAILARNGQPAGPPSPQLATVNTFMTNADTLLMNAGDTLKVSIFEVPDGGSPNVGGLETRIDDLTTGQSGYMIASAANGFMHTAPSNCTGTPYSFHAEYDTAKQSNQVGWAALEGGVLMEHEIGHFEPCTGLSNSDPISQTGFSDANVKQTCNGPFDPLPSTSNTGEGPCNLMTMTCMDSTTESTTYGGAFCTMSSTSCEFADGFCIPAGSRTITVNGAMQSWSQPIAGCQDNKFQNGDLDYDGSSYIADWPDGTSNHPTSFRYLGPFDEAGNQYPQAQFETDGPGSENNCNVNSPTASTCKVPPDGAAFYPFWSITNTQGLTGITTTPANPCVWNFGNDIAGVTTNDFSKTAQYGTASSHYGGTLISAAMSNPAIASPCPTLTESGALPVPANQTTSAISTKQFTLANSDGATWRPVSCSGPLTTCSANGSGNSVSLTLTPGSDGTALLSANSDLWTYNAGYNQDIGILVSGGVYPTTSGQPEAWKESGGFAGTFSPNAAFVQTAIPVTHGVTYTITVEWKTNVDATGAKISAGAGPIGTDYSPTRISALVLPASQVSAAVSTKQFTLANSDGATWEPLSCGGPPATTCSANGSGNSVSLPLTPASDGTALLSANSDLWTYNAGYNQDIGIFVSGGVYPTTSGQPEAWKESGGFAGTFSPNAAFVQTAIPVVHGVTYTITVEWKTNKNAAGAQISAGAGPIGTDYSPTALHALFVPAAVTVYSAAMTKQFTLANSNGSTWQPMVCTGGSTTCSAAGSGSLTLTFFTPPQTCTAFLFANADLWTYNAGVNQDIAIFLNGNLAAWKESGGFAGTFSPNAAFVYATASLLPETTYTVDVRWKSNATTSGQISAGAGPITGRYSPTRLTVDIAFCS